METDWSGFNSQSKCRAVHLLGKLTETNPDRTTPKETRPIQSKYLTLEKKWWFNDSNKAQFGRGTRYVNGEGIWILLTRRRWSKTNCSVTSSSYLSWIYISCEIAVFMNSDLCNNIQSLLQVLCSEISFAWHSLRSWIKAVCENGQELPIKTSHFGAIKKTFTRFSYYLNCW